MSKRKDSEPIVICSKGDDFVTAILDIVSHIQFKLFALILVLFLFLNTDVFINRVLNQFDGAVDLKVPTSYGILLIGLFLMIGCVTIDAAIRQNVI
jgi:cell division protein FtsX